MNWSEPLNLYCERLGPGLWAEPLNAVSNAAFFIAAALLFSSGGAPAGATRRRFS